MNNINENIKQCIEYLNLIQREVEKERFDSAEELMTIVYKDIEYLLDEIHDKMMDEKE